MTFFSLMQPLIDAILHGGSLPRYVPWHTLGHTGEIDGFRTTVVHLAMKNGRVDLLLPNHLAPELLSLRDGNGQTPMHLAAQAGCIDQIPEALITTKQMLMQDDRGRTPLHAAIQSEKLQKVPHRLITAEAVKVADHEGRSVADWAFSKGCIDELPEKLRSLSQDRLSAEIKELAEAGEFDHPKFRDFNFLSKRPFIGTEPVTWFHWLAELGLLSSLPDCVLGDNALALRDASGRTPLHLSVEIYGLANLPEKWITRENLLIPNDLGVTAFHSLAYLEDLGGAQAGLFSEKVLRTRDKEGVSVADLLEEHDQTRLLPQHLHGFARKPALKRLRTAFRQSFNQAENVWKVELSKALSHQDFEEEQIAFVREWSGTRFKHSLDQEQARAVVESGTHLLVSARAGSGKTGTLVARALFEMEMRAADPRKIVILAFNNNAARQVRERLVEKVGEERCPHVMTFHSLAYQLVHPGKGSILMDEKNSEEGKTLSQFLNNIIDDAIRNGDLVEQIQKIMLLRWESEWKEIVNAGGLLQSENAMAIREARQYHSIDGRHFESPTEKIIADELVRRGKKYKPRPVVFRRSGLKYTPAFLAFDDDGRKIVIDIEGTADPEGIRARDRYWNGDQSSETIRIELPDIEQCGGAQEFKSRLLAQLEQEDLGWQPLTLDHLWERIKKRAIGDFTRAITSFIGRCQKERWDPSILAERIRAYEDKLSGLPGANPSMEACVHFWNVCRNFFCEYLERLAAHGKTDFDHLMMDAASGIQKGRTRFRSKWSHGDLAEVQHIYVDEYQDFSHLFDALREAIQQRNLTAKFFCVGDDWQAINGFAGSNLAYFHGFQTMFSESRKLEILRNYRSAPEIVSLGNRVMAGKGSESIPTQTFKGRVCQIYSERSSRSNNDWEECLEDQLGPKAVPLLKLISRSMQEGKEILILFRNRMVWTPSGGFELPVFKEKLLSWFETTNKKRVVFSTTHSYKGGEADCVVLVDPEDYPLLHEERIFSRIFGDTDETLYEDERRLFYVGITRTKESLVLLRDHQTKFMRGIPVPVTIPFLRHEPIMTAVLDAVASPVFPGDRCMVRVTCGAHSVGAQFRKAGFTYHDDRKVWRRLIDQSPPQNRFECAEFLKGLPWLRELKDLRVEFVWKDRTEIFGNPTDGSTVNRGSVGATAPVTIPEPLAEGPKPVVTQRPSVASFQREADAISTTPGQTFRSEAEPIAQPGVFHAHVVGMKHHRIDRAMLLNTGEFVQLKREPSNSHDSNAVKVVAPCGAQIGYLSRHVAAHLARGLDAWGGVSQARVASVWKQPPPHAVVSIEICFPLPPGVNIPPELDSMAHIEDSPFAESKRMTQVPSNPVQSPTSKLIQESEKGFDAEAANMETVTQELSDTQSEELDLIKDARLRELIKMLARQQSIPWPEIGYEGGTSEVTDGTMLEVAWPDYKVGIALPEHRIGAFKHRKWTVFDAETVTKDDILSSMQ
jgi:DNA helicase-4